MALVLLALGVAASLLVFAASSCPTDIAGQPCPEAGRNRLIVVMLAAGVAGLTVTPFAFLAEFALRSRIVFRGAWVRSVRRGLLAAAIVAALGGLRLGGALSPAGALFVVAMAGAVEWFSVRRVDVP